MSGENHYQKKQTNQPTPQAKMVQAAIGELGQCYFGIQKSWEFQEGKRWFTL